MSNAPITNRKFQGGPVLNLDLGSKAGIERAGFTVGGTPTEIITPYGPGLSFNGTTDYITIPANYKTMPDAWSIETLVRVDTGDTSWLVGWSNANFQPCVGVSGAWSSNRLLIYMGAANWRYFSHSPVDVDDGEWHHLVFVLPGSAQNDILSSVVYADSQAQAVYNSSNAGVQATKDICNIGRIRPGGVAAYLTGDVQFIRFYDYVLSPADVTSLYNKITCQYNPV